MYFFTNVRRATWDEKLLLFSRIGLRVHSLSYSPREPILQTKIAPVQKQESAKNGTKDSAADHCTSIAITGSMDIGIKNLHLFQPRMCSLACYIFRNFVRTLQKLENDIPCLILVLILLKNIRIV